MNLILPKHPKNIKEHPQHSSVFTRKSDFKNTNKSLRICDDNNLETTSS